MAELIGNEVPQVIDNTTQVYKVTHEGVERLPLRNRSFISFSFGGKAIEDFNLLVTIQNRLQRAAYGEFEDVTSDYDAIDGQFYWSTHFKNNTIEFNLSTDAITEQELNEFKYWFRPGQIRQLVLAENPNRAIWARVSAAPVFSLVPMEKIITKKINGIEYSTSTTSYRGDIGISFVMDDPYWFSINSIIKPYYTDINDKINSMVDEYIDGAQETLKDKDFIKVILEDNIPHSSMIKDKDIIFGNTTEDVKVSDIIPAYLYYAGTSTGRPIIKFSLKPNFVSHYLVWPLNTYSHIALQNDEVKTYNILKIGDRELHFTAPAIYLGYNQAIDIMRNFEVGDSVEEARTALRDNVYEYYSRSWALFCLETMIQNEWEITPEGGFSDNFFDKFTECMDYFLYTQKDNGDIMPAIFTINSKTGKATGRFEFRTPNVKENLPAEMIDFTAQSIITVEENIEDMIQSDYFLIENRNFPNADGEITITECTKITTDYPSDVCGDLTINIQYQNEYL